MFTNDLAFQNCFKFGRQVRYRVVVAVAVAVVAEDGVVSRSCKRMIVYSFGVAICLNEKILMYLS